MSGVVSFADFMLDRDAHELRQRDTVVALSPKAFQLLAILVEHRPKALSKGDLQDRLWPDTFVVEKNLTNLVAEIRHALGDDPVHPVFIRTVPRFGYAFRDTATQSDQRKRPEGMAPSFRLVWTGGRAALGDGEHILGRDPDLELFFDSASVSRRHARIQITSGCATIEDLGSKNGTFIGDRRVDAVADVVDGDVLRIGSVIVKVSALPTFVSTETTIQPSRHRV